MTNSAEQVSAHTWGEASEIEATDHPPQPLPHAGGAALEEGEVGRHPQTPGKEIPASQSPTLNIHHPSPRIDKVVSLV